MKINRNKEIKIRLSDEEFSRLNIEVSKTGLSREEYLRTLIKKIVPSNTPSAELIETIKQLRAIGNNINQLVMIAHKTGSIDVMRYKNDFEKLQNQILEIMHVINCPKKLEDQDGNNKDMGC